MLNGGRGQRLKVNLVCLPLEGLDWLSSNHIVIDYGRPRVVFPESEGIELVSTHGVLKKIEDGATCLMIVAHGEKKSSKEQIKSMLVVDEYADVFPDEIPELPPSRDINFSIDLIPGAGLVSATLYRMAPVELAELKKQIENLLEKKFIRSSASPWGALVLLGKKKDGSSRLCVDYR